MKKNVLSAVIASAVLASGTVALAAYTYLKKGMKKEAEAEPEGELNEAEDEAPEEPEQGEEPGEAEEEPEPEEEEALAEEASEESEPEEEEALAEEAEDLESYMSRHPEEEESLNAVKDSFSADGVITDISVTGNTMFFDFVMSDVDDEDTKAALKPDLETFLDDQSDSYADIVRSIEDETGIKDVKMIVIFMDAGEDEIVSGHFDREGRVL